MKKIALALIIILICFLLVGCQTVTDSMGDQFELIKRDECTLFVYDKNTKAVYIVYYQGNRFGISPYIIFDEFNQSTIGQWNGTAIVPACSNKEAK